MLDGKYTVQKRPRAHFRHCVAIGVTVAWLWCICAAAEEAMPPSLPNPVAVEDVAAGRRSVADAAWWGFNAEDATNALKAAIDSGA